LRFLRGEWLRKVIFFNLIFGWLFEEPNKATNWHQVDDEFNEFANQQAGDGSHVQDEKDYCRRSG
jgi:hypothetical protein